ncbi:acetyltransferase [Candidatus Nitrospira bockiana]
MKRRSIILGAGGHAQVVADILIGMLEQDPQLSLLGFLDDDASKWGQKLLGLPVLGPLNMLPHLGHDSAVVAIGDNKTRAQLVTALLASGEHLLTAIHPRAILGRAVNLGPGSMVCAGVVINTGAELGCGVILNTSAVVEHHCQVGRFSHVAPRACLGGEVRLGEGVLIGLGAVVLPRRRIGDWTIVGAGAAVIDDIPAGSKFAGVPARPLRSRDSD